MKPQLYYYVLVRHSQIGSGLTAPAPLHDGVSYGTIEEAREALIRFLRHELDASDEVAAEQIFAQVRDLAAYETLVVDDDVMDGILCATHDRFEFVIKSFRETKIIK